MILLARVFWLAAPVVLAGIVHMVVVKRNLLARLAVPLDGGRTLGGKPVFGPNKTWRGVVFMTLAPALLGALQGAAWGRWALGAGVAPFEQGADVLALVASYACLNLALGFGYALGELPNSFIKRRVGIEAGKTSSAFFFVLDQADSVIAALLMGKAFFPIEWSVILLGMLALTLVHLALNAWLYLAKVRRNL